MYDSHASSGFTKQIETGATSIDETMRVAPPGRLRTVAVAARRRSLFTAIPSFRRDRTALIYRQIKELLLQVDPQVFWQIHRSTIVNINAVSGVVRDFQGHLRVRFRQRSETLPVSESHAHRFRHM